MSTIHHRRGEVALPPCPVVRPEVNDVSAMELPTSAAASSHRGKLVGVTSSLGSSQAREQLSARELEILQLISEGLTNKQIANKLWLSVETVKSHVSSVHAKLRADSRAHAVAIAFRHSLLT